MVKTAYVSRGEAGGHRRCRAASPPCRGGATSSAPTHSISSSSPPATTPWRQAAGIQDDAASFLPFRALLFGSGARLRELRREDEAAAPALLPLLDIVCRFPFSAMSQACNHLCACSCVSVFVCT